MMRTAALCFALMFLACARESADVAETSPPETTTVASDVSTQPPTNTLNPPVPPEAHDPSSRPTVAPLMHDVQLIEYAIQMPETVPAGKSVFNVANAGRVDHGFEIEGNAIEEKTDILKSGNTAALEIDLRPGTYTVYCPVKGHADKGMRRTVTVR